MPAAMPPAIRKTGREADISGVELFWGVVCGDVVVKSGKGRVVGWLVVRGADAAEGGVSEV